MPVVQSINYVLKRGRCNLHGLADSEEVCRVMEGGELRRVLNRQLHVCQTADMLIDSMKSATETHDEVSIKQ